MAICNGCGGVIGRDCFNTQECEWISRSMDIDDAVKREQEKQYERIEKEQNDWINKRYNSYPGEYYQQLFDYMADQHGVILLRQDMDEIISIVNKMQDGNDEKTN